MCVFVSNSHVSVRSTRGYGKCTQYNDPCVVPHRVAKFAICHCILHSGAIFTNNQYFDINFSTSHQSINLELSSAVCLAALRLQYPLQIATLQHNYSSCMHVKIMIQMLIIRKGRI